MRRLIVTRVCVWLAVVVGLAILGFRAPRASAEPPVSTKGKGVAEQAAGREFFEKQVRPLLAKHCLECHSTAKGQMVKGGLVLDHRAGWMAGGDSGPVIVPGDPEGSLLIEAVRYEGLEMPPQGKLAASDIAILERWVKLGAPDPRGPPGPSVIHTPATIDLEQGRTFWAFRPPREHAPPAVRNGAWIQTPIDRFILARLEEAGLSPAPDASSETWLRRVTFDLIGLPPTLDEQAAFLADTSPAARARVVDRLLQSPQFGIHWGRHWLDVARYADSNGGDFNAKFANAWRYRNYVIEAFNRDEPFDRFIIEQIAGDLLPSESDDERARRLIATSFLNVGQKMLSERDKAKLTMDVVDEQIDTIGKAFLGMTLGCARCHDHKFDPIPTVDYYALAGIFRSTVTLEGESQQYVSAWKETALPMTPEHAERVARHNQAVDVLQAKLDTAKQQLASATNEPGAEPVTEARIKELEGQLAELKKQAPSPTPLAMAAREAKQIDDCAIHVRGEVSNLGVKVPRGFLQVIDGATTKLADPAQSGRLELARWIARAEHPLTTRVIVNRVWQHVFGEGLVVTVDNFGRQGTPPTHPELLDTLAVEFAADGWSIKSLVRQLVLSHAYAQSARFDPAAFERDPDNGLLWRARRKRVPAESLRDSLLAMSGQLDFSIGGSPVEGMGPLMQVNTPFATKARTIFWPIVRNEVPGFLTVFDFADPDVTTGRRNETNVPAQALYWLNDPFVRDQAGAIAERLLESSRGDLDRVDEAYRLILGRAARQDESTRGVAFVERVRRSKSSASDKANRSNPDREAWQSFVQAVLGSTEFRLLD